MKKFFYQVFLFLAFILVLNLLVVFVIDYPRKDYLVKPKSFAMYLLGDSHTKNFNVELSDNLFNFGYGSDNLEDIIRKFKYLIRAKLIDDKSIVVIQIEPHMFTRYRVENNNNDLSISYLNNLIYMFNKYLPIFNDVKPLKYFLKKYSKGSSKGDNSFLKIEQKSDSIRISKRLLNQFGKTFEVDSSFIFLLKDIESVAVKNNISLIGVMYPVHPYYNTLRDDLIKEDDFISLLNVSFPIIDLSCFFSKDIYFRDQDHLNLKGSKTLLPEFLKRINSINNMKTNDIKR